jgi:hypothetical protein
MLLSIVYSFIIVGLGMMVIAEQQDSKAAKEMNSQERALAQVWSAHHHESVGSSAQGSSTATPMQPPQPHAHEPPLLELLHDPHLRQHLKEVNDHAPVAEETELETMDTQGSSEAENTQY